ncbi:F-box domain containing protein [Trema orientale]|uniref:F-box domain containing protein n=1 Tax=Trema orientale TaxID=63057 RepID=A0A2P5F634_TREOI|nr:F-box domain containing protein [Trema orientale]
MDALPDAIVQYVLSHVKNAWDVAVCNCISKLWKDSMPFIRSLYIPRNTFANHLGGDSPDDIVGRMVSLIEKLEELVIYSPFSSAGLSSWLLVMGFLRQASRALDEQTY